MNPTQTYNKSICVIVPVFNRINLTTRFLDAFLKSSYKNFKVVIANDGSTDETAQVLATKYPEVIVLNGDGNLWWTGGTNLGVQYALDNNFDYVLTINNDAVVAEDYLYEILDFTEKHPNSLVGSLIMFEGTNKVWSAGGFMTWKKFNPFNLYFHEKPVDEVLKEVDFEKFNPEVLNGDGTLIPIDVFRKIGLYNQKWTPQYHADSEIALRARKAGYQTYICPKAVLDNDVNPNPLVSTVMDIIFKKKSDFYWRAMFLIYSKYAPWKYKIYFFNQYIPFLRGRINLKNLKTFIKYWIKKK